MRRSLLLASLALISLVATLPSCAQIGAPELDFGAHVDGGIDQAVPDLAHDGGGDGAVVSCDLGSNADGGAEVLVVSATAVDGTAYAAARMDGVWSVVGAAGSALSALVATQRMGQAVLIGRRTDDTLVSTAAAACLIDFPAPTPIFSMAFTAERPAPVGGAAIDLVFRGSISGDQRLFHSRYDSGWTAAQPLGNFLSILPPVALRVDAQVHAIFTGTDNKLYDGLVDNSGGAATPLPNATSSHGPAAVLSGGGVTYVVFTGDDTNLYYSTHAGATAYTAPLSLCDGQSGCLIASNQAPVMTLDGSGAPTVAWIGKGDGLVYTSSYDVGAAQWSAPLAATTEPTALLPAIATGLSDSTLELVFARNTDGQGRHVRKVGAVFTAAVDLPGPKLGSQPSLVRLP
jgi:hypothetical protein